MFYEVRVLDSKNKLKKIISGQQLSRQYWDKFESHFNISSAKTKKTEKKSAEKSNQPIVHAKCKWGGKWKDVGTVSKKPKVIFVFFT